MDTNDLVVAMRNARAVIEGVATELNNEQSLLDPEAAAAMLWCAGQSLAMAERLNTCANPTEERHVHAHAAARWLPLDSVSPDKLDTAYYELYGEAAAFIGAGAALPGDLGKWISARLAKLARGVMPPLRKEVVLGADAKDGSSPKAKKAEERIREALFPVARQAGRRITKAQIEANCAYERQGLKNPNEKARVLSAAAEVGKTASGVRKAVKRFRGTSNRG